MVEVLGPLSARPPTPPRTTTTRMISHEVQSQAEGSSAILQTPGDSPFSANGSAGASSSRLSKKVNFSPWTKYIKPPTFTNATLKAQADLKVLPPSNECKPSRSILKATQIHGPVSSPDAAPFTSDSFAMLLESITQQLAGESVSSRLDAYMQFFGALRAYDGLPCGREISTKLGLITQFIQRDVTRDLEKAGPLDTNIVIQALKLSAALVWHTEISAQLSDDFKIFLVDHSIHCLQDTNASKSVVTSCLPILSTHHFSTKVMTNARLTRLLTALHAVTGRVSGNAIVSQRLSIYQRILGQSKSTFLSHTSLWAEHLISGLLHHFKDTRLKAIQLGFQISMAFGPNPILANTVRDIFDRPLDKGRKMIYEICERMSRMMSPVDSGVHIPQVWSIIILLMRSKRLNIDQWDHFKEWVLVLQKCFNCSEPAIKAQAMAGWNRFVFVISPNESTSPSMIKMLSKPIMSQLERKKQEKNGAQPSQVAFNSYYNLIYYAFRPSAPHSHLDTVWEEYIASHSAGVFSSTPTFSDRFAQVLSNLLWSSQAKVWSENKVNETSKLDPDELPTLDSKWIRSRITSILKVFENIFKSSVWIDDAVEKSNVAAAWISLSQAVSHASSKEITPSPESMQAVANVLGLLQRLWIAGPPSLNATGDGSGEKFFQRFHFLSSTMILSLGSIPFTEKLLLKTTDETFQAANTPTHRRRTDSNLDSPILHFLRLISDVSDVSEPTPSSYLRLIDGTLEAACNGRTSRGSRLEILRQCAEMYPNEAGFQFGSHNCAQIVWKSTAKFAADSLCSFPIESARERDGSVLRDYDNIVKILSAGLKFSDVTHAWNQLLDSFVRVVRTEKGDRVTATMIIEPLAECMMDLSVRDTYLPSTSLLSHSLSIPYCHAGTPNAKGNNIDGKARRSGNDKLLFPHKLVALIDRTLQESYVHFDVSKTSGVADFLESLTSLLGCGVLAFRSSILENLQQPLALWLRDEVRKLDVESGVESRILTSIRALSSAVLNILLKSTPHDAVCLQKFESIICAGLDSSHMSIAKRSVDMWRSTFGLQDSLACPMSISRALVKLELYMKHSLGSQDVDQESVPEPSQKASALGDSPEESQSAGFHSSPVTRLSKQNALSSNDLVERRPLQSGGASKTGVDEVSLAFPVGADHRSQRNEVFSMIDGMRSSSPQANTPRELGFMTPPHLPDLHDEEPENQLPLTPTLPTAAGENEEEFLGSSPTPGTRSRTQASGSELSSALSHPSMDINLDKDLPSSPPEVKSANSTAANPLEPPKFPKLTSPTPESTRSGNLKKKNSPYHRKQNSVLETGQSTRSKHVSSNHDMTEVENPETRRLRSSTSKRSLNASSEPNSSFEQSGHGQDHAESAKPSLRRNATAKTAAEDDPPPHVADKYHREPILENVDSSSDEMDTQIASQLEQDMGLLVHVIEKPAVELAADLPHSFPMTRKRKREVEETQTPPNKERRRSSRRSFAGEPAVNEPQEARSARVTRSFQELPTNKSSPAVASSKRRKVQPKNETNESTVTESPGQDQSVSGTTDKESEALDPSPRKRRRSTRLGGHAASSPTPEEVPTPKKSPRTTRSRKQETRCDETGPQDPESPQEESRVEVDTAPPVLDQESEKDAELPARSPAQNEPAESPEPVHEVPDSLAEIIVDRLEPPAILDAAEQDIQMNDAETPMEQASNEEITERFTSLATQTEEADNAYPETDNDEARILRSLRKVLDETKSATLDRSSAKQIDDLLFDIRVEMLEAMKRHTE